MHNKLKIKSRIIQSPRWLCFQIFVISAALGSKLQAQDKASLSWVATEQDDSKQPTK
jgi:hypothetical protein